MRLERRLKFVMTNFQPIQPTAETSAEEREAFLDKPGDNEETSEKRTEPDPSQPEENTGNQPEQSPIAPTGNTPEVRAYYNRFFPSRERHIVEPVVDQG